MFGLLIQYEVTADLLDRREDSGGIMRVVIKLRGTIKKEMPVEAS
jgi:hypothetical protein